MYSNNKQECLYCGTWMCTGCAAKLEQKRKLKRANSAPSKCGGCGRPGHNIRTCHINKFKYRAPLSLQSKDESNYQSNLSIEEKEDVIDLTKDTRSASEIYSQLKDCLIDTAAEFYPEIEVEDLHDLYETSIGSKRYPPEDQTDCKIKKNK